LDALETSNLPQRCRIAFPRAALFAVLAVLITSSLLLFAACGDDSENGGEPTADAPTSDEAPPDGTGPPADFDVCALVTPEEAESALGGPVGEPERAEQSPIFVCGYDATDQLSSLVVTLISYDSPDDAQASLEYAIETNEYPEIEGIGDGAYNGQPLADVTAISGGYELSIDVNTDDAEADLAAAQELAKTAISRLP
jgi:hypothetical protein